MKLKFNLFLAAAFVFLLSCKKDNVDGTTPQAFQASINDMSSSLNTLQQTKFNEALYILKTFGTDGKNDQEQLSSLAKMLDGKSVKEIFAMADQVAASHNITWSSDGPPSLGSMNIFGNEAPAQYDPNDIKAADLSIEVEPLSIESGVGPKAYQIIPRLMDSGGNPIKFTGAALEAEMEVSSGGSRLLTMKSLMQDSDFQGFNVRLDRIPASKVLDNAIDITISVKTTKKTFRMLKTGVPVNSAALKATPPANADSATVKKDERLAEQVEENRPANDAEESLRQQGNTNPAGDPRSTVEAFLKNLNDQNFRGAYGNADNPAWSSYEAFANPASGFGGVKNISIKSIGKPTVSGNAATVNASYEATDKEGNTTPLKVTFGLKNVNGNWKISSYKIN
ncbi:hypothetical protein SAMN05443429_10733 [Cruoricaptor ignavus]|uniref:NTF2-like N-terminal transpeptidase domain-containing protein n=1 Tax=Cruoricaptor ignavus TaxID=1118202 RepID=A0A1M6FJC8_9FLAO|nr:NTF2-like N-terminal transpeptidase [Cruoricaptor ignavus]SHI97753.1 hypothetical protein SAMN05443429_10733 [Cruoricaptor ignavus]